MIRLHPTPPYDFALTARAARYYSTLAHWWEHALWRCLRIGNSLALIRVTEDQAAQPYTLTAELLASRGTVDPALLKARLHHWLALDADMAGFYAWASHDPVLTDTVGGLCGLHILRTDSMFEAVAVTLIEQQIALSAAQRAERWLAQTYGDYLDFAGQRHYAFPTPERLAQLDVADLMPLKITFRRMERLLAIARAQADGSLDLERAPSDPDKVYHTLIDLKGIGHWTAAWSMIRALGVYVYVGSADVALRSAVNHYWYGAKGRASREDTDACFSRYGKYGGIASVYTLMRWGMFRYPILD